MHSRRILIWVTIKASFSAFVFRICYVSHLFSYFSLSVASLYSVSYLSLFTFIRYSSLTAAKILPEVRRALVIILSATIGFYTQLHHRIKDLFKSHQERESIFQANDRATEMILPRNDSLKGTHHLTRPRKAVCAQTL